MLPSRQKLKKKIYKELKQTLCTEEKILPSEIKQRCSILILKLRLVKSILDLDDFLTLQPIIEETWEWKRQNLLRNAPETDHKTQNFLQNPPSRDPKTQNLLQNAPERDPKTQNLLQNVPERDPNTQNFLQNAPETDPKTQKFLQNPSEWDHKTQTLLQEGTPRLRIFSKILQKKHPQTQNLPQNPRFGLSSTKAIILCHMRRSNTILGIAVAIQKGV